MVYIPSIIHPHPTIHKVPNVIVIRVWDDLLEHGATTMQIGYILEYFNDRWLHKEINNQCRAIRWEFEHVGPCLFKNPLVAG